MIFRSAVSPGKYYPHDSLLLLQQVDACYYHPLGPGKFPSEVGQESTIKSKAQSIYERLPVALIVPHGAIGHSGPIAAHAYGLLAACVQLEFAQLPEIIVVIGPDHLGLGSPVSATTMSYTTPLGAIPTEHSLIRRMLEINLGGKSGENLAEAPSGHVSEHSVENQIPFLQHLVWRLGAGSNALPHFPMDMSVLPRIIPLTIASQNLATAQALGELLDSVLPQSGVLMIASSDMSHCGPFYANMPIELPSSSSTISNWCAQQTQQAVNAIITMNPLELQQVYQTAKLSMCGVGGVMAAIEFAHLRGATEARLLAQSSSLEVASSWVGHLPIDQNKNVQSPWNLLTDVDPQNPVGFASIALI
jgi:predicted class III extradiol MEMO1 family dioxygenase